MYRSTLSGSGNDLHPDFAHDLSSFHLNLTFWDVTTHVRGAASQPMMDAYHNELPVLVSSSDFQGEGLDFLSYMLYPFQDPLIHPVAVTCILQIHSLETTWLYHVSCVMWTAYRS